MTLTLIIAILAIVLLLAFYLYKGLANPQGASASAKMIIFILALLFTFGSGLCAFSSTLLIQPVAILAVVALAACVYTCRSVHRWRKGLPFGIVHPLIQVVIAALFTIAAYVVAAFTIRLAG